MRVRVRDYSPKDREIYVHHKRIVATFTVVLDHFHVSQMKLMDCPDRGLVVWPPSHVRFNSGCREAILRAVMRKIERAERFSGSEA